MNGEQLLDEVLEEVQEYILACPIMKKAPSLGEGCNPCEYRSICKKVFEMENEEKDAS